jgi:hypothetical protein
MTLSRFALFDMFLASCARAQEHIRRANVHVQRASWLIRRTK